MSKRWIQWDFTFLGSKITSDGDCSHEIKRHLLLGRKSMTNLDSILKSRDITLPTKVLIVKAMVFPVVMYGCESWAIKMAGAEESMPKGNQAWIFIERTDAEAEAPIIWPPDAKNWLAGKDPDAGKDWMQEEKRLTEDQMVGWHDWLNWPDFAQGPGDEEGQGNLSAAVHGVTKNQIRLSDGTTTSCCPPILTLFISPLYFNGYVRLHSL